MLTVWWVSMVLQENADSMVVFAMVSALAASWGSLGNFLAHLVGLSWSILWVSWCLYAPPWGPLGACLGYLGAVWCLLGPPWDLGAGCWMSLSGRWRLFGNLLARLGTSWLAFSCGESYSELITRGGRGYPAAGLARMTFPQIFPRIILYTPQYT